MLRGPGRYTTRLGPHSEVMGGERKKGRERGRGRQKGKKGMKEGGRCVRSREGGRVRGGGREREREWVYSSAFIEVNSGVSIISQVHSLLANLNHKNRN